MKGDMSLWVLTKFAMVFFIMALALILTSFGGMQQEQTCNDQTGLSARTMASRISQVVYAPVEDERRIYKLPASITLGEGRALYGIEMRKIQDAGSAFLTISLRPQGTTLSCGGGNAVSLPTQTKLVYVDRAKVPTLVSDENPLEFHPSEFEFPEKKSKFLVVLKCSTKLAFPPEKYLYLQDCTKDNSEECLKFEDVERCCGWPSSSAPTCP